MDRTLVLVQFGDIETARQVNAVVREHRGRLTPLQAGTLVRRLGAITPFVCACGCMTEFPAERLARSIERRATLS